MGHGQGGHGSGGYPSIFVESLRTRVFSEAENGGFIQELLVFGSEVSKLGTQTVN